jgi:hypothetical protein
LLLAATKFSKGLGYVHGIWNVIRGLISIGGLVGAVLVNEILIEHSFNLKNKIKFILVLYIAKS